MNSISKNSKNFTSLYRFGFQNQESDNEISGEGNSYSAEFWQYNPRIGKRWNPDPVVKHHESPYACFANNPIWFSDANGADTADVMSTLSQTNAKNPFEDLMRNSPTFKTFFNSFTCGGKNEDIKMRFQVDDSDPLVKGSAQLMYQGQWVGDRNEIPADAKLEDFEILISLNTADYYVGREMNNADRTSTLIHELLLHANTEMKFLNMYINKMDNTVGQGLVKTHNNHFGRDGDHEDIAKPNQDYFAPLKVSYREIIEHYEKTYPIRKTDKVETRNGNMPKPYWKVLEESFKAETTFDPKKPKKH